MLGVQILLSGRGWILERLVRAIAKRYQYVTHTTEINTIVPILCYMTYGIWRKLRIAFEIAYSALKPICQAGDKFFRRCCKAIAIYCDLQLSGNLFGNIEWLTENG